MEQLKKKVMGITALAFAVALGAGVYSASVEAKAEETLANFAITATSVRLDDPNNDVVDSGLRFKVDAPVAQESVTEAYTVLTLTPVGGTETSTVVPASVWRSEGDGWNTVLLDVPASDYGTVITAQAFMTVDGTEYATEVVSSSIAKTAALVMNSNNALDDNLLGYLAGVESVKLDQKQATAFKDGEALQLTATQADGYAAVWSSDNTAVATVDKTGKVTPVGKGVANITAQIGSKKATCAVTSYEKVEIDTVDEFMGMPTGDEYAYVTLTQDIDFAGTLIQYNGTASDNTYLPIGTDKSKFKGVLDGKGNSIYNVTVGGNGNAIGACVFWFMEGTIKNLSVDMSLQAGLISAKNSAFIYYMYANSVVENCYVKYASHVTQYKNGNGTAIAPIVAEFSVNGGEATIRNCVGVMDLSAGVTHPVAPFGGAATIMGGIKNPNGVEAVVNLENCYGVMLTKDGDTVHTAKLDSRDTGGNYGTVNKETSSAYSAMYDMYAAAKTGMTAENGWNNFWSVKDGVLKFGDETIFEVYEISSAADFMALPMDDASAYCVLTKDIDFAGIVINQTEGYNTIGTPAEMTEAGAGTYAAFNGVLDGQGYALKNVSIVPLSGYAGTQQIGSPALFGKITGTVKNLSVTFSLSGLTVNSARYGGFTAVLGGGARVSNCFFDMTTTHYVASNYPEAPLAGSVGCYANTTTIIENCVGVLREVTNSRNNGLATGLVGRISGEGSLIIKNCYAVEVNPKDGGSPEYYETNWAPTDMTATNVSAYTTLADMFTAASTGMTAANGWNSLWSVDATAGTLKFGATTVYAAA